MTAPIYDWGEQCPDLGDPFVDGAKLGLELVDETLREIALAIEHEIDVRLCCHRPADEIEALRWCLELVNET